MMPDMTPWSYPKRNTPKDTKILVKYLDLHVSAMKPHYAGVLYTYNRALPVRPPAVPEEPMMAPRQRAARVGGLGLT